MKKRFDYKKGQMRLSFGRIFSIILAIVFIAFAVYGITQFLSLKDSAQVGKFKDNFRSDLEQVWRSSEASTTHTYTLPSEYVEVCVKNPGDNEKNLELLKEDQEFPDSYKIECGEGANCLNVPGSKSCANVSEGKVSFRFEKSLGSAKVNVTAA
ncbi:MAG: hypothetical protein ABEI74_00995 [Candidatus Pacearchaeota archaeon]